MSLNTKNDLYAKVRNEINDHYRDLHSGELDIYIKTDTGLYRLSDVQVGYNKNKVTKKTDKVITLISGNLECKK